MSRAKNIRVTLKWSQQKLASFLAISQPVVCRLEKGEPERGAVVILLDQLEFSVRAGVVVAGMSPLQARALVFPSGGAAAVKSEVAA